MSQGRRYEVKVAQFDSLVLIIGCIGLALTLAPIIYASAVAHIIASFLNAPVKWLAAIIGAITLGVSATIYFGAVYAVQSFYFGISHERALEYLQLNWLLLLASSVVVSGIVGTLFSYPGSLDELREAKDNAQSHTTKYDLEPQ